jgi:hypothetical protein
MEISRESREEVAPGQRPGEAWATRPLAPDERERIRSFYPRTLGRDYRYLGGTALAAALLGLAGALLLPFPGSSGGRAAQIASGFVYMSLAALAVWAYNPRKMRRAVRERRPRPPRSAWVLPVEVIRWQGRDSEGQPVYEARCYVQGQLRQVRLTAEQWEWFPEGAAQVEMLPGGRRHLYRFHFGAHSIELYPEMRRLGGETPRVTVSTAAAGIGAPELVDVTPREERRRRRPHQRRAGWQRRLRLWIRRQDMIWLLVVIIVGGGLTFLVITARNRVEAPPAASTPRE